MKFTLIQFDIAWEDRNSNRQTVENLLKEVTDTDVIVLPEMFTTGFSMNAALMAETMDGETVRCMQSWAEDKEALVLGSVIIIENGQYFNRLVAAYPDGAIQYYDKRHLFSYANEDETYTAGETVELFIYKQARILPQICYDVRFPVFSRYSADQDFNVMVYVANFPEKRIHAWNTLLMARAIENQCYVVAVNRSGTDGKAIYYDGSSQVIDYSGKRNVLIGPGTFAKTVFLDLSALDNFRVNFPFLQDRDTN